jgi:hypothetical protein
MGDGESFADMMGGAMDVPWVLDPPDWLLDEWTLPSSMELPELVVESGELSHNDAPGLHLLASVATGILIDLPTEENVVFDPMDMINTKDLKSEGDAEDSVVILKCDENNNELSEFELDRDQYERCRSPGEDKGRIGPNSPMDFDNVDNDRNLNLENLMKDAGDLAQALTAYSGPLAHVEGYNGQKVASVQPRVNGEVTSSEGRCVDCTANGPCLRDICTVLPNTVIDEAPQSPDYESDRDDWSDSSDGQAYCPVVSPISSEASTSQKKDYELSPSRAQKYWSEKMRKSAMKGQVKRVASVRPRTRWIRPFAIQALQDPRRFRVTTQSPILSTRAIISRVIGLDGLVTERALHDQFVMSRSVATQTAMPGNETIDVETMNRSMATQTVSAMNNVAIPENTSRSIATQTGSLNVRDAQTSTEEDVWEVSSEGTSGEEEMSCDSDEDSDEDTGSEISSDGTPVQDE